ncbi:MAG TPA: hypothetical protein VJ226_17610 [Bradyrhizobium sp.]|nr:hypothetical protein [Bradyrhizobium sp.]
MRQRASCQRTRANADASNPENLHRNIPKKKIEARTMVYAQAALCTPAISAGRVAGAKKALKPGVEGR